MFSLPVYFLEFSRELFMNLAKLIMFLIFSFSSTGAFSYGGGEVSTKACNKPRFTEFTPAHLTVVLAQSEFTFIASASTNPKTIDVNVKKLAVEIEINKMSMGYLVKGTLPDSLQNTYARVNITATGTNNCVANDGWLLKIE